MSLPITRVNVGMTVVDADGVEVGRVGAVQPPGTEVRPFLPAGPAERAMAAGYVLVDAGERFDNDVYVEGDHVSRVDGDRVTLSVGWTALERAVD